MVLDEVGRVLAASTLFMAANFLGPVKIERLQVPALVEMGVRTHVLLDCPFHVADSQGLVVEWLLDGNSTPVYRWEPPAAPTAHGPLEGKLDLHFKAAEDPLQAHRALLMVRPGVELGGAYTCRVSTALGHASQTKTMLIYSGEHDMQLSARAAGDGVNVTCSVRDVFPAPELVLERLKSLIAVQSLRVWAREGSLRSAEASAHLPLSVLRDVESFFCRLQLPAAHYEALRNITYRVRNTTRSSKLRLPEIKPDISLPIEQTIKPDETKKGKNGSAAAMPMALLILLLVSLAAHL